MDIPKILKLFIHQIFELTDQVYQACCKEFGSKRNMWWELSSYIQLFVFESWELLWGFALTPLMQTQTPWTVFIVTWKVSHYMRQQRH